MVNLVTHISASTHGATQVDKVLDDLHRHVAFWRCKVHSVRVCFGREAVRCCLGCVHIIAEQGDVISILEVLKFATWK